MEPEINNLPEGWISERLSEISGRITKGSTPTSYGYKFLTSGIKFIKVENIKNGKIDHSSIKHYISDSANQNQKRSILQPGDILYSIAGTIGSACMVTEQDLPANTNQALAIIRGTKDIFDPKFLQYQLLTKEALDQLNKRARGGGMNNVSLSDIGDTLLKIAPLDEQHRIVAKLEKLMAKVDKCKERMEKIPAILKRFRQSVLAAACSGDLTADWRNKKANEYNITGFIQKIRNERNKLGLKKEDISVKENNEIPSSWITARLSFFIESMANGIYKPSKFYSDNGVACLRMYNIQDGRIIWKNLKRMILTDSELKNYNLQSGDILVNRVNSRELVGKAAIIENPDEPLIFESKNIRLRLIEKEIMPKFVNYCFMLRIVRDSFERRAKQTVGMATISQPQISGLFLPIPPIEEQKEIISRVESLFKIADQIKGRYLKAAVQVDKLTQSILAKAFRGELVLQDPNDEPASELLKRIQSEKEMAREKESKFRKSGNPYRKRKMANRASDKNRQPEAF